LPSRSRPARSATADVALVTYRSSLGVPREDRVLATALRRAGRTVAHPVWNDPRVDWSGFGIAIVRSTWDYHRHRTEFLRWSRRAATVVDLWNRPEVLRWNTDKRYLRDLTRAGVPVVPTAWVRPGRSPNLAAVMDSRGWASVVVKPSVSAAGERTVRVARTDVRTGQRHLVRLLRSGAAMVQPYRASVEREGERSLVYLGGRYSHSVRRVPLFPGPAPPPRETPYTPSRALRRAGDAALRACPGDLLYARVDLVADDRSRWQVLEVELTEPSLFFVPHPAGADTMASEIGRRLRR
jgi:hypothetical protein